MKSNFRHSSGLSIVDSKVGPYWIIIFKWAALISDEWVPLLDYLVLIMVCPVSSVQCPVSSVQTNALLVKVSWACKWLSFLHQLNIHNPPTVNNLIVNISAISISNSSDIYWLSQQNIFTNFIQIQGVQKLLSPYQWLTTDFLQTWG